MVPYSACIYTVFCRFNALIFIFLNYSNKRHPHFQWCDAEPLLLCLTWRLWKKLRNPLHNHSGLPQGCSSRTRVETQRKTAGMSGKSEWYPWDEGKASANPKQNRARQEHMSKFAFHWLLKCPHGCCLCASRAQNTFLPPFICSPDLGLSDFIPLQKAEIQKPLRPFL